MVDGNTHASLRVATWNIDRCIGTDGVMAPERCAAVLDELDADIVALQEVDIDSGRDGQCLYPFSDMAQYFAIPGATMLRGNSQYGNVILTRVAPDTIRRHDLSVPGREPRGAIDIDLTHRQHRIRFVATHLGLRPGERRAQVQQLLTLLRDAQHDLVILAGDLNEWFLRGRLLRMLHREFSETPHLRTWPSQRPIFALDRIWARPGTALQELSTFRTRATKVASDHLPLVAELRLPVDCCPAVIRAAS